MAHDAVVEAYRAHRSNVEVETGGLVLRVLPDDREGSRHERFIVRVGRGPSVLVAHNIDLAPRVPVAPGESVELRGEYEWNARGGVIHWTHRDPVGRHEAGGSGMVGGFISSSRTPAIAVERQLSSAQLSSASYRAPAT